MGRSISLYGGEVTIDFDEVRHAYMWREIGKPVDGFSKIVGILDKPALKQWAADCATDCFFDFIDGHGWETSDEEVGPQTARPIIHCDLIEVREKARLAHRSISKTATDTGKIVHKFAEQVLVDRRAAMPSDPQAAQGAAAFLEWFHAHKIEPIDVERIVMSRKWYYAGTCDFFGHIDGELCVLDFKTSNPFKTKWRGPYIEQHLQLAAYATALDEELGTDLRNGWVIRLDKKTGKCDPHKVAITTGMRDCWLRVRELEDELSKLQESLDGLRKQAA